ncbi:hypothetical protein HNP11_004224 [Tsukamurella ocularis]|nr:hypothetical protein [Tsukamurella ocularis]
MALKTNGALTWENEGAYAERSPQIRSTILARKSTSSYPVLAVDAAGTNLLSHAGTVLLLRTAEAIGLNTALTSGLSRWRTLTAVHDPGKIVADLVVSIAAGGDCLTDAAQLRAQPAVGGKVASDSTVSRLIGVLAADPDRALAAITAATAAARAHAWQLAGDDAPDYAINGEQPLIIDLDATLVTAHSEKENAAPNFKRGFGFHPLLAFVDHGLRGTGEPVAVLLRPGNAGSNTAADHISVVKDALTQLPDSVAGSGRYRVGRKVLIRADGGGGTHEFLDYFACWHLSYSIGFGLTDALAAAVDLAPEAGWIPAIDKRHR